MLRVISILSVALDLQCFILSDNVACKITGNDVMKRVDWTAVYSPHIWSDSFLENWNWNCSVFSKAWEHCTFTCFCSWRFIHSFLVSSFIFSFLSLWFLFFPFLIPSLLHSSLHFSVSSSYSLFILFVPFLYFHISFSLFGRLLLLFLFTCFFLISFFAKRSWSNPPIFSVKISGLQVKISNPQNPECELEAQIITLHRVKFLEMQFQYMLQFLHWCEAWGILKWCKRNSCLVSECVRGDYLDKQLRR